MSNFLMCGICLFGPMPSAGIFETAMYFVLYERSKAWLSSREDSTSVKSAKVFCAAAASKFLACSVCYPHGSPPGV